MTTARKVLREGRPNGHALALVAITEEGETLFYVTGPDDEREADGEEFETEAAAVAAYEAAATRLAATPNWRAQAAYDDAHGTEGGYAPWQSMREW